IQEKYLFDHLMEQENWKINNDGFPVSQALRLIEVSNSGDIFTRPRSLLTELNRMSSEEDGTSGQLRDLGHRVRQTIDANINGGKSIAELESTLYRLLFTPQTRALFQKHSELNAAEFETKLKLILLERNE